MLRTAVAAVCSLPMPRGLGSGPVLDERISVLAGSMSELGRDLALAMATREGQAATEGPADSRRQAVLAGMPEPQAQTLRAVGRFASGCPVVQRAWRSGEMSQEQVQILGMAASTLPDDQATELVERVVPLLRGLDARTTRRVVGVVVDQLAPEDQEATDRAEYAARHLTWTGISGGLTIQGFLPTLEGAAFRAAIEAMAESLRIAGDGVRVGQRRADALAEIVARAAAHGLPTGGGLPAAVTLTVPLGEAERIATRDPSAYGCSGQRRPRGPARVDDLPHGPTHTIGDAAVRFALCATAITPMIIGPRPVAGAPPGPHTGTGKPGGGPATRSPGPGAEDDVIVDVRDNPTGRGSPTGTAGASHGAAFWAPPDAGRSTPRCGADGWASPPDVGRATAPPDADRSASPPGTPVDHAPGSLMGLIATTQVEPLAVGRAVRLATAAQRRALQQRDQGCVIQGCQIPAAYTQPHHVTPWTWEGPTDQENLASCCWVHHRQIELGLIQLMRRLPGTEAPPGALEHPHWWVIPSQSRLLNDGTEVRPGLQAARTDGCSTS